jgi:hypothetical protein
MLFTKSAKLEQWFHSGVYRLFGHTKTSHIFHVVLSLLFSEQSIIIINHQQHHKNWLEKMCSCHGFNGSADYVEGPVLCPVTMKQWL